MLPPHNMQGGGDGADWREPLPQYEQVTAEVLAHDLDDARRLQVQCGADEVDVYREWGTASRLAPDAPGLW